MPSPKSRAESIVEALELHLELTRALAKEMAVIEEIADAMSECLSSGGKILWCGNGGSAADSQHLCAELVGRFRRERRAIPSLALTTNSSIITAIANDYDYESIFARQIEALGRPGDLIIGISTSGNSANVVSALAKAKNVGLVTVAFTGQGGGNAAQFADHLLAIPSSDTARIQEMHILIGHILCDCVEAKWIQKGPDQHATLAGADNPYHNSEAN